MDEADFDGFYGESYARVVGHLYAMTGDLQEAQDCVQEAYARAWDRRHHRCQSVATCPAGP